MYAHAQEFPNEKAISGALALVMHALFFAMLVFSVTWQKREPVAMVAELWSSLPSPRSEVPPSPPKVEPEPSKPEPKVEAKPVPKVEPKPQPKAEIDLREKKEKELKAKEQALVEKKKREEEAKRREQEQADALKKIAQQEAAAQAEAAKKAAQQQAAAQGREIDKYKQAIAAKIRRFIVEPPNLQGNPEVEMDVTVLPGGEVLGIKTRKGSGQTPWDNAVERAIQRAQPLPLPPADSPIFREFRELNLKFRPKD